jgi:gas vesicle protein
MSGERDNGTLIFGIILGVIVGGLVALLKSPTSGILLNRQIGAPGQGVRSTLSAVIPRDPVAESMAEGKAAARRRMTELGQGDR